MSRHDCSYRAGWTRRQAHLPAVSPRARKYPSSRHCHNQGKHSRSRWPQGCTSCSLATYATTVTLDDDLQQPPEELPKLVEKLREGFDVVYGSPESGTHGFFR